MKEKQRSLLLDKIILISIALLVLFAWVDSQQIVFVKSLDNGTNGVWALFEHLRPVINLLWFGVLAAIALVWYLITQDKSESLALFLTPAILIFFGFQDLIYYVFSPIDTMPATMGCWANMMPPVRLLTIITGESCPTPAIFTTCALLGFLIAMYVFYKLKEMKG